MQAHTPSKSSVIVCQAAHVEKYFFLAGNEILQRIKDVRNTVILPERTGPIADVLYSAADNSADEHWYNRGVIAYSFETGADRYAAPPAGAAARNPRELCAAQPVEFVRPCWYRAFLENRSEGFTLETPEDLEGLCEGLAGVQRAGCVTAAALIGPPDPSAQLDICARMPDAADAASCVRGTKVQNLLDAPTRTYVGLIGRCARFAAGARAACYRWLGKALAVLTDGAFARDGCPRLRVTGARRECLAGARTMEDALVTFS